jgi:hypothetical protein
MHFTTDLHRFALTQNLLPKTGGIPFGRDFGQFF